MTTPDVMTIGQLPSGTARCLLERFSLTLHVLPPNNTIPGSYWGDSEAGIIGTDVYVRPDTPVHSLLHESCHIICMDDDRRRRLHTDAGGETPEEDAVCYLQIVLARELPEFGQERALLDMDRWGYTFRLGSARRWFEEDAQDARLWLQTRGLIDELQRPCFRLNQ